MKLKSEIDSTIEEAEKQFKKYPERRLDIAEEYVMKGLHRPYPVIFLNRNADPQVGEILQRVAPSVLSPEERLLKKIKELASPLNLLNPISPTISLGKGTGSIPASFGIFLDPELGYTPTGYKNLDHLISEGIPDLEKSGIIPEMKEDIDAILEFTPEWFKIGFPDMQGPFNISHMCLGNQAFLSPLTEPEKFHRFMAIITDFFIGLHKNFKKWIGEKRYSLFTPSIHRIAECSVNLISKEMYKEFVLPYDMKISNYYGEVAIHPCSGPHVFYETIRNLPHVIYSEAGYIEKTTSGSISVDDAITEIGNRSIILNIGQELPKDREEEFIRRDFDRAKKNPRLLFGYTGMHWRKKDEEKIKKIHLRLDDYWNKNIV